MSEERANQEPIKLKIWDERNASGEKLPRNQPEEKFELKLLELDQGITRIAAFEPPSSGAGFRVHVHPWEEGANTPLADTITLQSDGLNFSRETARPYLDMAEAYLNAVAAASSLKEGQFSVHAEPVIGAGRTDVHAGLSLSGVEFSKELLERIQKNAEELWPAHLGKNVLEVARRQAAGLTIAPYLDGVALDDPAQLNKAVENIFNLHVTGKTRNDPKVKSLLTAVQALAARLVEHPPARATQEAPRATVNSREDVAIALQGAGLSPEL